MPESYLGIDVGWSQADATTGLCRIESDQTRFSWECRNSTTDNGERSADLRSLVRGNTTLTSIGIDGPLVPGLERVNCYRAAEALIARSILGERCRPGQTNSPNGQILHDHATELATLVRAFVRAGYWNLADARQCDPAVCELRIVEAFPTAFLALLLADDDFGNLPDEEPGRELSDQYWEVAVNNGYLRKLVDHLDPGVHFGPLGTIRNHDRRAAFVCALSAMCVARGRYVAVGAPGCGFIVLPPHEVWRADARGRAGWAESALRANVDSVRRDNGQPNPCPNFNQAQVIRNGQQWLPEQQARG